MRGVPEPRQLWLWLLLLLLLQPSLLLLLLLAAAGWLVTAADRWLAGCWLIAGWLLLALGGDDGDFLFAHPRAAGCNRSL